MNATSFPGIFVTIEGVDGSGKTVLAKQLVDTLNNDKDFLLKHQYAGAIYLREPGSTEMGEDARPLFQHPRVSLASMTEVHLLLACKVQLLEQRVRPEVHKGVIVICDRYTRTLLAYQGGLRGIPYQKIVNIVAESGYLIPPNIEFFLHVSEETSAKRRAADLNEMDALARENGQKLRQGYADAKKALPPYLSIDIDGEQDEQDVHDQVLARLKQHLKLHRITGQTIPDPIPHYVPEEAPQLVKPRTETKEERPEAPHQDLEDGHDPSSSPAGDGETRVPDPA
jgi:dTMP kinase